MLTNEMIEAYKHYAIVYNKEINNIIDEETTAKVIETAYRPFRDMIRNTFDKTTAFSILDVLLKNEHLQIPVEKNLNTFSTKFGQ